MRSFSPGAVATIALYVEVGAYGRMIAGVSASLS